MTLTLIQNYMYLLTRYVIYKKIWKYVLCRIIECPQKKKIIVYLAIGTKQESIEQNIVIWEISLDTALFSTIIWFYTIYRHLQQHGQHSVWPHILLRVRSFSSAAPRICASSSSPSNPFCPYPVKFWRIMPALATTANKATSTAFTNMVIVLQYS